MRSDLRHAGRLLLKAPGFTALAAGTLALGIAASTAIFSLADAVVLVPLPYEHPQSRVMIWNRWRGFEKTWTNPAEARAWKERCPSLVEVTHWQVDRANLTGEGEALRVGAGLVSANTFAVLGARPTLGRSFTAEEDRFGGPRVVVLGHALWQGRFGGQSAALGRTVALDGVPHEVVGVMPPGFALPTDFGENAAEPTQLYGVAERRQEIAVRLALGARPWHVRRLVLGEGLLAVGAGLVVGLTAAALLSRLLRGLLHEVKPVDLPTYGAVALGLVAVAVLAGLVPALQATRTDPAVALRQE